MYRYLHFCKETRNWSILENENAGDGKGFMVDSGEHLKQSVDVESVVLEKMMKEDARTGEYDVTEVLRQEAEVERQDKSLPCAAPLLQWGQRKRSRCCRSDNHNLKPCNSPDDSAVLFRKSVRVQADNALVYANPPTSKGALKATSSVAAKKEHHCTARITIQAHAYQEEKRKQAKLVKNGLSDASRERKESSTVGTKRGCPASARKQEHPKKACTMPELRSLSPETGAQPNVVGEASPSKVELVWPKLVIGLSRKEKEEDFLIFKGTKLPQRPRRRSKAVERILHYCTPGSWLVDMSHSRYDVREKKRAKKKPRGLKAMESLDSDSE